MRTLKCALLLILFYFPSLAAINREAAVNIITYWPTGFRVDTTPQGERVRRLLNKMKNLGIDTVIFNFRAKMVGGYSNHVTSVVSVDQQPEEERQLLLTSAYAKSLGLKVAFRPILLIVGPNNEFPYTDPDGKIWWHGVIQPASDELWFQSFFAYHARYMRLAQKAGAAWYSIGAEMHSLTSGLGSRNPSQRFGRPDLWLQFIKNARQILGPQIKITYGANFTDQYVLEDGIRTWGGEFEQWRHDLTFTPKNHEEAQHQNAMRAFWNALDFIGLDYYRALGAADTDYPTDYLELLGVLTPFSIQYATNLNKALKQIASVTRTDKFSAIQEVGYRSVEKCFVSPYLYEDGHTPINYLHQAVAWDALLTSLWNPQTPWMKGVGIWQVLVDDDTDSETPENGGFSPLGKNPAEQVLKKYFLPFYNEAPVDTDLLPPTKDGPAAVRAIRTNSP